MGGRIKLEKDGAGDVLRFVEQLGVVACIELAEKAVAISHFTEDRCFKYFAKCCWNQIKGVDYRKY